MQLIKSWAKYYSDHKEILIVLFMVMEIAGVWLLITGAILLGYFS